MKPLNQFSQEHLLKRLQGLANNLFFANGRLCLPSEVRDAFNETYAEVKRRGPVPKLDVEDWIQNTDPVPTFHSKCLVRYDHCNRLKEFIDGKLSFGPAQNYAGLSNPAQRDNEVARSWHEPDTVLEIGGTSYPTTDFALNHNLGEAIHYHSLSFSLEESPKLQRAFCADGYVLVHDYNVFFDILHHTIRASGLQLEMREILYFDDRNRPTLTTMADFVFSKCIAYKYQREVRLVVFDAPKAHERFRVEVTWPFGLLSAIRIFERA